jgi:hypothetical protein
METNYKEKQVRILPHPYHPVKLISQKVESNKVFGTYYPDMEFATTKFNDLDSIFEITSGCVVGFDKTCWGAVIETESYLRNSDGKFGELVDKFKL